MKKLSQKEFIEKINGYIGEQESKEIALADKLIASEMDSFDYAFFWAYVQEDFEMFTNEYCTEIVYEEYTLENMWNYYNENC